MSFNNLILRLVQRPAMYIGDEIKLESIMHYLNGCLGARKSLNALEPFEVVFMGCFTKYISEKYDIIITNENAKNNKLKYWCHVITANSKDEADALKLFYDLYNEFYEMYENGIFDDFYNKYLSGLPH